MIKTMLIVVIWFNFGLFIGHMLAKFIYFIYQEDIESWYKYADNKAKSALEELRDEIEEEQGGWLKDSDAEWHECQRILRIINHKIGDADEKGKSL